MSIENPRQEAGEPSVPDFRWLHDHGLFRVDPDGKIYQIVDHDGEPFETAIEWTSLPADAVNLGDVEALRAGCKKTMDEAVRSWNKLAAERDEAKRQLDIAESVAANTKAHYIRRCENLASVRDRIRGERDEARAKLAEIRAAVAGALAVCVSVADAAEERGDSATVKDVTAIGSALVDPEATPAFGDVIKCQRCGRQTRSISRGCSVCKLGREHAEGTDR